ncbi:MAG: hypothetical protein PHI82_00225, partial [Candidatus Pacebacteria bacterium]|nr:hypothetical protein [Candidatus Paceibacterota bacterium]
MLKNIIKKRFFILFALISVFLGINLNAFAFSDFNSDPRDTPLEGINFTQDRSNVWKSSLTNVNPGDQLKFNVYYHNASD